MYLIYLDNQFGKSIMRYGVLLSEVEKIGLSLGQGRWLTTDKDAISKLYSFMLNKDEMIMRGMDKRNAIKVRYGFDK